MSKSGDSSAGTTKNPEHESGYFEDGSDVETIVEEPIVIEERNYGSTCYTLSKDIDDFDMRDFNEPAPDYDEDRVNLADSGGQRVDMTHFDLLKVLGTGVYSHSKNLQGLHIYDPHIYTTRR